MMFSASSNEAECKRYFMSKIALKPVKVFNIILFSCNCVLIILLSNSVNCMWPVKLYNYGVEYQMAK